MKAVVYRRYGGPEVLALEEIEKPAPKPDQVLLRVHASSVNAADRVLLHGKPFGVRLMGMGVTKPKHAVLGFDAAGRVETVGSRVESLAIGDEVFGACEFGGFAEYACVAERTLVPMPANASFEHAAGTPTAAYTALQALRDKGRLRPGQHVLIDGASGGVGTFAVQIAKVLGAEVTAVCSTRNVATARSIGADHIVDYTKEDFASGGRQYELIIGANAYRPLADYARALAPKGTYVMIGGGGKQILEVMSRGLWLSMRTGKKLRNLLATAKKDDLLLIKEWLETGQIAPVIERVCPLSELPAAIRRIENEHARGKTVIRIADASAA